MSQESVIYWKRFSQEWSGIVFDFLTNEEVQSSEIPQVWRDLIFSPKPETIQALWSEASSELPRFIDYLAWGILDAKVANSKMGYLLIYYLRSWKEIGLEGYENSFMMAGLPTEPRIIEAFAEEIGDIPSSLKALWRTHGFVQCRNGTFFASLNPGQQELVKKPVFFPQRRDSWRKERVLDCLGIVDISGQIIPSLTRAPGTGIWKDTLVEVDKWGDTMMSGVRTSIDDLLADWRLTEWEGSNS